MTISRNLIIPLPQWRANPQNCAQALHEVGAHVLALYPQTTCFYKGIIATIPETSSEDYVVLFEDNAYPSGFSPPMSVPQKYIVQFPSPKCKKIFRPLYFEFTWYSERNFQPLRKLNEKK